jgi:hypothetical protein
MNFETQTHTDAETKPFMSTKYSAKPSGQRFSIRDGLKFLAAAGLLTWFMFISAGQFISTIKDSSIVSVISIQELTFQGMELMSATFLTFEVWITVMLLYLVICLVCSLAVERLEIHMKRGVV